MKRNPYLRIFFTEPDDAGGGIADLVDTNSDADLGVAPDERTDDEPKETPPAPTPVIDYDKFGAAIAAAFPKPAEPSKPQLSKEEIARLTKDWEPDDVFLERLDNIATKKAAIKELFDRAAARAEALAQVHTYGEVQRLQQTFGPQLAAVQELAAQQREARFNSRYPDLAKSELKPVISAIAQQVLSTQKFADEDSAFDAVAKGVERVIQSHTPTFKLKTRAKSSSNPNELAATSAGSGGGGGDAPTSTRRKGPPGIDLFQNLT